MDQIKIGNFIKELRKEKGMTQEQLAEQLNTSRRTVSRWETGSNLPDLDVLLELSKYFEIDIRELFEGERKMEQTELEETMMKAAEYTNQNTAKLTKMLQRYFIVGIISLIIHECIVLAELPDTFITGFLEGFTLGGAIAAMIVGILFTTGKLHQFSEAKHRLFNKLQGKA